MILKQNQLITPLNFFWTLIFPALKTKFSFLFQLPDAEEKGKLEYQRALFSQHLLIMHCVLQQVLTPALLAMLVCTAQVPGTNLCHTGQLPPFLQDAKKAWISMWFQYMFLACPRPVHISSWSKYTEDMPAFNRVSPGLPDWKLKIYLSYITFPVFFGHNPTWDMKYKFFCFYLIKYCCTASM